VSHSRLQNERKPHSVEGMIMGRSVQFPTNLTSPILAPPSITGGGKLYSKELNHIGNPNRIEIGKKQISPPLPRHHRPIQLHSLSFSLICSSINLAFFPSLHIPINTTRFPNQCDTISYMQYCGKLNPINFKGKTQKYVYKTVNTTQMYHYYSVICQTGYMFRSFV
jgi:hypothetical protein